MDILYRIGRATVSEVMAELTGAPNYSTVARSFEYWKQKDMCGTKSTDCVIYTYPLHHGTACGNRR